VQEALWAMEGELRTVRQKLESREGSEAISKYPVVKYQQLVQELGLTLVPIELDFGQAQMPSSVTYQWDDSGERQQADECLSYLSRQLSIPKSCVLQSVDNEKSFLDVSKSHLGTSHGLQGTSDIAVLDRDMVRHSVKRAGILVLFELKKAVAEGDVRQAQLELIASCKISQFRPVVVLTDLQEEWRTFWLCGKQICMTICSRAQALFFLNRLLASHDNPGLDLRSVLPDELIDRTLLSSAVPSQSGPGYADAEDDYQDSLLTKEEQIEQERQWIMSTAAKHLPWMYS